MLLKCPWITSFESRVPTIAVSFSESLSWASFPGFLGVMPWEGYIETWQSWWCSRLKDTQTDRLTNTGTSPWMERPQQKHRRNHVAPCVYRKTLYVDRSGKNARWSCMRQQWQEIKGTYTPTSLWLWIGCSELRTQTTDKILSVWGR